MCFERKRNYFQYSAIALEAKEGDVVSFRDRKMNFEEDIKDAEPQIKSKYS